MATNPSSRYLEHRDKPRFSIAVQAAIYVPTGIVLTALLLLSISALPGTIFAVILLSIGAFAFDMQAYHAVADLLTPQPTTSRGRVERMWTKGRFLFLGRVRYLLVETLPVVDGQVDEAAKPKVRLFEVGPIAEMELRLGDEVEVVHWPHTNSIVTLERILPAPQG